MEGDVVARFRLVDVFLHASSCQGAAGALGCDGDRGGVGVDGFDEVVLCQVGERLVQFRAGDLGSGEVRAGRREEQGRADGRLVACGVVEPSQEGVHRVAQPGGAVLLKVLQPLYGNDAFVGEVDVGGSGHVAGDVHQAVLLELESKDGGIFVFERMFFDEPGHVDVFGWSLLVVGVQPHQQLCQVGTALDRPDAAQHASRCAAFGLDLHTRRVAPRGLLQALLQAPDVCLRELVEVAGADATGHVALLSQMSHSKRTERV